jgi:hypothetical protein
MMEHDNQQNPEQDAPAAELDATLDTLSAKSESDSSYSYMELIGCETAEDVYERVRQWTSGLSEHEHLVRSTRLDIHANIEARLKQILYHANVQLILKGPDEEEYEQACQKLETRIRRMGFVQVHDLLRPALSVFPADEFDDIHPLNELRNTVTHREGPSKTSYKGRNPFTDADCFAQVYFDAWAIDQQLVKFYDYAIAAPRGMLEFYGKFYEEHRQQSTTAPPAGEAPPDA